MVVVFIATISFLTAAALYWYNQSLKDYIEKQREAYEKDIINARQEALVASRNTVRGQVSEELAPLFGDFPYSLSDCKFAGAPYDYLVFNNMSAIRDGDKDKELEIVFAEVKVNKAKPTKIQKEIKRAIEQGRVRFETWRIIDNKLTIN